MVVGCHDEQDPHYHLFIPEQCAANIDMGGLAVDVLRGLTVAYWCCGNGALTALIGRITGVRRNGCASCQEQSAQEDWQATRSP